MHKNGLNGWLFFFFSVMGAVCTLDGLFSRLN